MIQDLKKQIFIFIFSFSAIFGGAYNTNRYYDFSHSSDSNSYIKMASGNYEVTVTHKYRFIIPLLVNRLNRLALLFEINSSRTPMVLFLIVNSIFMSFAGLFLGLILLNYNFSFSVVLLSLLPFLTSRWAEFASGLPLVESLYLFSIFGYLYGIITKNYRFSIFMMLLGLLSKESFWLYVPLIGIFTSFSKIKYSIFFIIFFALIFLGLRFYIDFLFPYSNSEGLSNALNHFSTIHFSLMRILSIKGLGELFFVFGWFNLIVFVAIFRFKLSAFKKDFKESFLAFYLVGITLVQMLLSGDTDRMFFLISPLYCVLFAFSITSIINSIERRHMTDNF